MKNVYIVMHSEKHEDATGSVYGIFSTRKKAEKAVEKKSQYMTDHLVIHCVPIDPPALDYDYSWNDVEGLER